MPMMLSRERILTTHVGSLPRNDELSDLLIQREEGEPVDMDRLRQAMDRAVEDVVKNKWRQASTSETMESSSVSLFQRLWRSACRVSPANPGGGGGATMRSFPSSLKFSCNDFPGEARCKMRPRPEASCGMSERPHSRKKYAA